MTKLFVPVLSQLPRYLNFDLTRRIRPFYTEFCVYQKADDSQSKIGEESDAVSLSDVVCSKSARVYNFEGRLKQGCTSFYTLKRFGTELGSEGP